MEVNYKLGMGLDNRKSFDEIKDDKKWSADYFNSPFQEYYNSFKALDYDSRISGYISSLKNKPRPVIVDLMAPPGTIVDMQKNVLDHKKISGLAVSLTNQGDDRLERRGIHSVAMDITDTNSWRKVDTWLKGRKADLVMERAVGGISYLPTDFRFFEEAVQKVWGMISHRGGMALLQTPPFYEMVDKGIHIDLWVQIVKNSGVVIRHTPWVQEEDSIMEFGALMLQKTSYGEILPSLNARRIAKILRKY